MPTSGPCTAHSGRVPYKTAAAYWAWFDAKGDRVAYKIRYCKECLVEQVAPLILKANSLADGELIDHCYVCGGDCADDYDPTYLTLYIPGQEPLALDFGMDSACAARVRIPIAARGRRLPNRPERYQPPEEDSGWTVVTVA